MLPHDPAGQAERQGDEDEAGQGLEDHGGAPGILTEVALTSLRIDDAGDFSQATEKPRRRHMGGQAWGSRPKEPA
jgi:hypothetical protein